MEEDLNVSLILSSNICEALINLTTQNGAKFYNITNPFNFASEGQLLFDAISSQVPQFQEATNTALKRSVKPNMISAPKSRKMAAPLIAQNPVPNRDVGSIFKDLNLMPEIPDDLQCALCCYKATQKGHLKTHYQLKHLGGAGISATCSMCQQKFATRSSLKRHMMSTHKLTSEQAGKLMS